eukprot:209505-Rhodomonas_salina.1
MSLWDFAIRTWHCVRATLIRCGETGERAGAAETEAAAAAKRDAIRTQRGRAGAQLRYLPMHAVWYLGTDSAITLCTSCAKPGTDAGRSYNADPVASEPALRIADRHDPEQLPAVPALRLLATPQGLLVAEHQ